MELITLLIPTQLFTCLPEMNAYLLHNEELEHFRNKLIGLVKR